MENEKTVYTNLSKHETLPPPVLETFLVQCRSSIEPPWKRSVRKLLLPYIKWKLGLKEIGEGFQWGKRISVKKATFGNFSSIGPHASFSGPVIVGDLTMISSYCRVIGQDHVYSDCGIPTRINFSSTPRPVTIIDSDVWIGAGVTIMEGVRIHRGSVVAASAVVTKDIPPYSVVAGVPALRVKERFSKEDAALHDQALYGQVVQS